MCFDKCDCCLKLKLHTYKAKRAPFVKSYFLSESWLHIYLVRSNKTLKAVKNCKKTTNIFLFNWPTSHMFPDLQARCHSCHPTMPKHLKAIKCTCILVFFMYRYLRKCSIIYLQLFFIVLNLSFNKCLLASCIYFSLYSTDTVKRQPIYFFCRLFIKQILLTGNAYRH